MSDAIKMLPSDLAEGIERFIKHLCVSEAMRDDEPLKASQYRGKYDIEIRRSVAHIWEARGQRSSVAWIVLGDGLICKAKPTPDEANPLQRCHFKRGDILKSATWKAPAKNFARGNVLTDREFPRWHWNGWI